MHAELHMLTVLSVLGLFMVTEGCLEGDGMVANVSSKAAEQCRPSVLGSPGFRRSGVRLVAYGRMIGRTQDCDAKSDDLVPFAKQYSASVCSYTSSREGFNGLYTVTAIENENTRHICIGAHTSNRAE